MGEGVEAPMIGFLEMVTIEIVMLVGKLPTTPILRDRAIETDSERNRGDRRRSLCLGS